MSSNLKIINFPITPFTDDIASYINSLSLEQLYHLFDERNSSDILTAALYTICQSESNLLKDLYSNNSPQSWILDKALSLCPDITQLNYQLLHSLNDVYYKDNLLFKSNLNNLSQYPDVFIMTIDNMYSGHIYAWTVDMDVARVTNIIGIRSSLLQLMIDRCGLKQHGITPLFINAIKDWAVTTDLDETHQKDHYIRFLQPLDPMPNLLSNYNFSIAKPLRNSPQFKWLYDNLSLGKTPLTFGLIFREYDYILKL